MLLHITHNSEIRYLLCWLNGIHCVRCFCLLWFATKHWFSISFHSNVAEYVLKVNDAEKGHSELWYRSKIQIRCMRYLYHYTWMQCSAVRSPCFDLWMKRKHNTRGCHSLNTIYSSIVIGSSDTGWIAVIEKIPKNSIGLILWHSLIRSLIYSNYQFLISRGHVQWSWLPIIDVITRWIHPRRLSPNVGSTRFGQM